MIFHSYCADKVKDSWGNRLNSWDENGLRNLAAAQMKCQATATCTVTSGSVHWKRIMFPHLTVFTFLLSEFGTLELLAPGVSSMIQAQCGVCWAVQSWSEHHCGCNQSSPTNPNPERAVKSLWLRTALLKPWFLKRFLTRFQGNTEYNESKFNAQFPD